MRIDLNKFADAIVAMAEGKSPAQLKAIARDVVQLLRESGAVGSWRRLEKAIDRAWAARYGAANVTVVSAHALTAEARATLASCAQGADVREVVDDRLIGGAIIRMDHTRIDGSVTGALMRLKNAMYLEV